MGGTELYERIMRRVFMAAGARSRFVDYGDNQRAHVLDLAGKGQLPTLVMAHGFSATGPTQYGALVRQLRPHFRRLVLPEMPGHGHSSLPAGGLDAEVMVEALTATLDALLDGPAVLFASSMAGGVAVHYALRRPQTLLGLMLCSPSGAPFEPGEIEPFLRTFRVRNHRDALGFVDRLYPYGPLLRHVYAWGVRQQFNRPHLVALLEGSAQKQFLQPADLAALEMPVHLLWGAADDLLPASHLRFYREHLPAGTEIESPTHFGHAPFLHQAPEVAEILLRFVRHLTS